MPAYQYIPTPSFEAIPSPVMLETGVPYASYIDDATGYHAVLTTEGETSLTYKGETYHAWKEFPKELQELIQDHADVLSNKDVDAARSSLPNFRVDVFDRDGKTVYSDDDVNASRSVPEDLEDILEREIDTALCHERSTLEYEAVPLNGSPLQQPSGTVLAKLVDAEMGYQAVLSADEDACQNIQIQDTHQEPPMTVAKSIYDVRDISSGDIKEFMERDLRDYEKSILPERTQELMQKEELRQSGIRHLLNDITNGHDFSTNLDIIEAWNAVHPQDHDSIAMSLDDAYRCFDDQPDGDLLERMSPYFDRDDDCCWIDYNDELVSGSIKDAIQQKVNFSELSRAISWNDERIDYDSLHTPVLLESAISAEHAVSMTAKKWACRYATVPSLAGGNGHMRTLAKGAEYLLRHNLDDLLKDITSEHPDDKRLNEYLGYHTDLDFVDKKTMGVLFHSSIKPSKLATEVAKDWIKRSKRGSVDVIREDVGNLLSVYPKDRQITLERFQRKLEAAR